MILPTYSKSIRKQFYHFFMDNNFGNVTNNIAILWIITLVLWLILFTYNCIIQQCYNVSWIITLVCICIYSTILCSKQIYLFRKWDVYTCIELLRNCYHQLYSIVLVSYSHPHSSTTVCISDICSHTEMLSPVVFHCISLMFPSP